MTQRTRRQILAGAAAAALSGGAVCAAVPPRRVEVFAHRGASALRPEHTLASYAKAIADGADYVEPDLCCTKDGVLIARHEPEISETTDVSKRPEFAARRTTRNLDGQSLTGWFTNDFTLAELKTLRAVERLPAVRPANTRYDGQFQVPTFEEIVDFVAAEAAARERVIGLVPEIKHSTYFAAAGLAMEDRLIAALAAHDYTRKNPVEIQSFEVGNLKVLRRKLGRPANVRLMQLTEAPDRRPADVAPTGPTYGQMTTPEGLRAIAEYADVVAPPTRAVIPLGPNGWLLQPTPLVRDAHAAGLLVHTWTFRPENRFLAADFQNGAGENARNPAGSLAEIARYIATGIDGFFTDDPAIGRLAVELTS